jgi:hypothetical protein
MIKISQTYHITLTEQQARELYELLNTERRSGHLTVDHELTLVHNELKYLFDTGIR